MKKMNKLFFTMCMVGGFAAMFSSCKKNEETADVAINLPAFEEEADGRAYIDFNVNKFKWNANDQVVIYNLDNLDENNASEKAIYSTTASAEGTTTARFNWESGDKLSAKKYGYFVFYPASKATAALEDGNYQTFTINPTQQYTVVGNNHTVDPESMAMACELSSLNSSFTLKHIFGTLRLRLTGTGNVNKIVVEDARFNLHGSASMKLHKVRMDAFSSLLDRFNTVNDPYGDFTFTEAWSNFKTDLGYMATGGGENGKQISLENIPSVQLSDTQTSFFLGIRPGALKYGFKIYVYLDGENTPREFDYTGDKNPHINIKAGVVRGWNINVDND